MYEIEFSSGLDRKLFKLAKKNRSQLEMIDKKIAEIVKDPFRFKNLRGDMKGAKRVHIDKHFVLVFDVDQDRKVVRFLDFAHHDKIY